MAAKVEIIVEAEVKKAAKELGFIKERLADISEEERKLATERAKQVKLAEEHVSAMKAEIDAETQKQEQFKSTVRTMESVINIAKQVLEALKQIYATAREGAELLFLEDRFERLAESIHTTADALLGDMKEATRGTMDDFALMALATDLVGLGLARDAKEAVRMARVVAGLGADMNQLTLTLTNMTTMRFDAIGVRVEGFKDRLKGLEDQGMDTSAAFTEAFLQQAEQQLETVGEAADSTLGTFLKLETRIKNMTNETKVMLSEAVEPSIAGFNKFADNVDTLNDKYEQATGGIRLGALDMIFMKDKVLETIRANEEWLASIDDNMASYDKLLMVYDRTVDGVVAGNEEMAKSVEEISKGYTDFLSLTTKLASETKNFNKSQADNIAKQEEIKTKIAEATIQYGAQSDKVKGLEDDLLNLGFKYEENAEKHKASTDKILFDLLLQKLSVDGLTDAEFDAALAAGQMFGVFDAQSAQTASDMNTVTQAVTDGVLRVEDMDKALRLLPRLTNIDVVIDAIVNGLGGGARGGISGGPSQDQRGRSGPGRAAGGTVARGRSYVVGERRPELFTPNSSGRITPRIGGGSSIVVNLAFAPTVSLGGAEEAESVLVPFVIEGIRQAQASGLIQ